MQNLDHCIRVLNPGESFAVSHHSKADAEITMNRLRTDYRQYDAVILVVSEAIPTGFLVIIAHPRTKVVTTEELEAR